MILPRHFFFLFFSALAFGQISCQSGPAPLDNVLVMEASQDVQTFELIFGLRKKEYTRQELEQGIAQLFHCQEPFNLKLENGQLNLSTTLYDVNGDETGEVKNNVLVSGSDYFKTNYDAQALEFINELDIVAMRIEIEEPNKIIMSGAVKCDPEVIISSPDMTRQLPSNTPENEATLQRLYGQGWLDFYREEASKIDHVFEYTGSDYIGKRKTVTDRTPVRDTTKSTFN